MNTKKTMDMWTTAAAALVVIALLAVAAFAQSGASFRFFGPLSRVITPNGDSSKNNGTAIFCFDNPAGSGVSGSVYSLLGSAVATMGPASVRIRRGRAVRRSLRHERSDGGLGRLSELGRPLQRDGRPQRHLRLSDHGRAAVLYGNDHRREIGP